MNPRGKSAYWIYVRPSAFGADLGFFAISKITPTSHYFRVAERPQSALFAPLAGAGHACNRLGLENTSQVEGFY